MNTNLIIPIIGAVPLWLLLVGALAIFMILRFITRLILRFGLIAAIALLFILFGHL